MLRVILITPAVFFFLKATVITTATAAAICSWHCFVYYYHALIHKAAVQFFDSSICLYRIRHFYKTKTTRLICVPVNDYFCCIYPTKLGKRVTQLIFCSLNAQITHENVHKKYLYRKKYGRGRNVD